MKNALCLLLFAACCSCSKAYYWELVPESGETRTGYIDSDSTNAYELMDPNSVFDHFSGEYRVWHKNGKLFAEEHWQNGERHGSASYWDDKGRVTSLFITSMAKGRAYGESLTKANSSENCRTMIMVIGTVLSEHGMFQAESSEAGVLGYG